MAATDSGFSDFLPLVRPLDEEQARLVEILVAAEGSEVSFEELRRQGIENPAVLAYELEIAGLPITHVQRSSHGGRASAVGLRLDSTLPLGLPSQERPRDREPLEANSAAGGSATANGHVRRPAAPRPRRDPAPGIAIALAALVLGVIIIALVSGTGSNSDSSRHGGLAAGARPTASTPAPTASTAAPPSSAARASHRKPHPAPAVQAPPLSHAAQLQQTGHLLLAQGRYAAAISELRASLAAGGESATTCSQPTTPGCVAYADTLYDLGRALRLDNAHAAAGAVLRERLRINSQHAAVQHELGLNRRRHGSAPTSRTPAPHAKTPDTTTPKHKPAPPPTPHPITGGASAPAP